MLLKKIIFRIWLTFIVIVGVLIFIKSSSPAVWCASQPVPGKPIDLPGTPVGKCAAAYFKAFNSGDDQNIKRFLEQYQVKSYPEKKPIEDRIKYFHKLRGLWHSLTPIRIAQGSERKITVLSLASGANSALVFYFQLENEPSQRLAFMTISGISPLETALNSTDGYIIRTADRAHPIDDALGKDTVRRVAKALKEQYIFPDTGKKMARVLMKHLADGQYDKINKAGKLADQLTNDAFAVSNDRHIWVEASRGISIEEEVRDPEEIVRMNYGFRKVELLPGNIGYIKFDMFRDDQEALKIAAAALAFVANCEALIFDLRENSGGMPKMLELITGYLFAKPTLLGTAYDREGNKVSERWSMENIPGKRFAPGLPVFILTGKNTGSAAESFAYNLKHYQRATIVGETTIGMAHPVKEIVINENFHMLMPFLRGENPNTKTDWEGVGVLPHIKVPRDRALDTAIKEAKKKRVSKPYQ